MVSSRKEQLAAFVREHPQDAFGRYGLAMELMRGGEPEAALAEFRLLHEQHPDYAAGFQQAGQLLLSLDRRAEARAMLERGLAASRRQGDRRAAGEMQGLLDELDH
ncbi:MAG: tetratricopeptide repeat protein [Terriglobales bacterium]